MSRSKHMSIHFKKDMSDRRCFQCGSNYTYITKKGYMDWRKNKDEKIICVRCYNKNRDRRKVKV